MKLKQRIPDKSEALAVGPIKSKIKRGDSRFKSELIRYPHNNVVFKDEEKSGSDYMMTPPLAECLNILAGLVSKEWPGLKLRVTEAWDENNEHSPTSTHYEGRSADITISDRDRKKLGRLGALAVEAGFHWVFYEDQYHVHVSMRNN